MSAEGAYPLRVEPRVMEMGAFYNGGAVRVQGETEAGTEVIVAIRGPERGERFNRKRHLGPIWISSGRVEVSGAPSLWMVFSAKPAGEIVGRETLERYELDERAIFARVRVEPRDGDEGVLRGHFLAMKKQRGVYGEHPGRLETERGGDGRVRFHLNLPWPKTAPPDSYTVTAYHVRGGQVVREATEDLRVVEVGFPAWIAALAESRASLYGLLAVLIAVAAGFGMDALVTALGGRRGGGH